MLTEDAQQGAVLLIHKHLLFSILTATVTASLGLSLSMPRASAITTCPKQPSPSGFPRVNLHKQTKDHKHYRETQTLFMLIYRLTSTHPDTRFQSPCTMFTRFGDIAKVCLYSSNASIHDI